MGDGRPDAEAVSTSLLRMPKGVPAEIARVLLRTSSRRIPRAGQVLSYENATILYDLLTQRRSDLRKPFAEAARHLKRARTSETRQKWLDVLAPVRKEAVQSEAALLELEEALKPEEPEEETAVEWEFGTDYLEDLDWSHDQGQTSDVSINARIYRSDGQPMTKTEAFFAANYFAEHSTMPRGIQIQSVSWRDYKQVVTRHAAPKNLASFERILDKVSRAGQLRVGSVEPDWL
jgi:hypothetical protein